MIIQPSYAQSNLTNHHTQSFQGIPFARVKLKQKPDYGDIVIYQLEKRDIPFLKEMLQKIRLDKLAPEVKNQTELGEWKHLIKQAAAGLKRDEEVYLSTYKNRPCAIMSQLSHFDNELFQITYFASFPYKVSQNVKCAGKSLFKNILEQAKSAKKGLCLVMSKKAPKGKRDNSEFYKKMKFQDIENTKRDLKILSNKDVSKVLETELDRYLDYQLIKGSNSVSSSKDLKKLLDINY